ncbi:hypothetical protein HDU98_005486 [Podochytrium sp. JEL0797]|nr:hypothetical protein HDU98_005486 [Podochytrium sp. JEL0797]
MVPLSSPCHAISDMKAKGAATLMGFWSTRKAIKSAAAKTFINSVDNFVQPQDMKHSPDTGRDKESEPHEHMLVQSPEMDAAMLVLPGADFNFDLIGEAALDSKLKNSLGSFPRFPPTWDEGMEECVPRSVTRANETEQQPLTAEELQLLFGIPCPPLPFLIKKRALISEDTDDDEIPLVHLVRPGFSHGKIRQVHKPPSLSRLSESSTTQNSDFWEEVLYTSPENAFARRESATSAESWSSFDFDSPAPVSERLSSGTSSVVSGGEEFSDVSDSIASDEIPSYASQCS